LLPLLQTPASRLPTHILLAKFLKKNYAFSIGLDLNLPMEKKLTHLFLL
jgi:hypothetical protein